MFANLILALILHVNAPVSAPSCETIGPRLDGTFVTICDGHVTAVSDGNVTHAYSYSDDCAQY